LPAYTTVTTGWRTLPATDDPLELARAALAGRQAWLVGGAVRDRLLGVCATGEPGVADLDIVLDGEPREAARAIARATSGASAFALSEEYGGWRVVARGGSWQVDLERLRGATLEDDLALRDFTVNAIAERLGAPGAARGETIDPLGGREDIANRRLRAAGPRAFAEDPLRVLRLVRIAVELDFEPDAPARAQARACAEGLHAVAGERVFAELRRILDTPRAVHGVQLLGEVGATPVVLPELDERSLEVLGRAIAIQGDPAAALGEWAQGGGGDVDRHATALAALLAEPLADGLTRGGALRWGALLAETGMRAEGACLPASADLRGAELAGGVLRRLRTSGRLQAHVAALVRHRPRLGLLAHEPQPLPRRTVFAYLRACEPVEVDVTLLSIAGRLAGHDGDDGAHLRLARGMLGDALRWRAAGGPPPPLLRGDELARELGIPLGPRIGELLEELAAARYTGEIATREQALEHARAVLGRVAFPEL
jgi:poly(A) polymerase